MNAMLMLVAPQLMWMALCTPLTAASPRKTVQHSREGISGENAAKVNKARPAEARVKRRKARSTFGSICG